MPRQRAPGTHGATSGGGDAGGTTARSAARHRRGLRRHRGAGRLQGAGRAARPRRLARDGAQRHGRARGRGLHHPAAHQRRPGADRQGLPALRRPADHGQADERPREARDLDVPRRRGRPRRRRRPLGAGALAADPPGRDGAVPHALALHGPPHRAGRAGAEPAPRRAHPQQRPGRAAHRRAGRRPDRPGPLRAPHPAQLRRRRRGDRRGGDRAARGRPRGRRGHHGRGGRASWSTP